MVGGDFAPRRLAQTPTLIRRPQNIENRTTELIDISRRYQSRSHFIVENFADLS
jgi:hypothetical protein